MSRGTKRRNTSSSTHANSESKRLRTAGDGDCHSDHDSTLEASNGTDIEEISPPITSHSKKSGPRAQFYAKYDVSKLSNEAILDLQREKWKSSVYDHFETPQIVETPGKEVQYKFVCKTNPRSTPLMRVRWDNSTGNLMRHCNSCDVKVAPAGTGINDYAHGSTYSKAKMRYECAIWVSQCSRPYSIIRDPPLQKIFRMLYSRVEIPHPTTLSRDVQEIFEMTRMEIAKKLQTFGGRLHVCIDGWTAPHVISFLGVTVHFTEAGKMRSFILDFIKLIQGHTGAYLAKELRSCFKSFGIETKLLGLVADNASNNQVVTVELESLGGINSKTTRVRCFAHILNLVVKAIIILFAQKKKTAVKSSATTNSGSDDNEIDDAESEDEMHTVDEPVNTGGEAEGDSEDEDDGNYEVDADREADDEETVKGVVVEVASEQLLSEVDRTAGRFAVTKLVGLAKRVFHSPTLREDLKACCVATDIIPKQMKRAVATRWNSLAQAIARALYLRKALDRLVSLTKYDKSQRQGGLRHFRLSEQEWSILTQLYEVLKDFLHATERISQSNVPLIHEVIPIIDILRARLTSTITNSESLSVVRTAAASGLKILDKYYSATDESIMYRAAILLHPRYKTEYFRRQKWKTKAIHAAEDLVREMWTKHYRPAAVAAQTTSQTTTTSDVPGIFDELDAGWNHDCITDPLEQFLSTPTWPNVKDPLSWHHSQMAGGDELSVAFAQMCLDFLSVPASSVDVERAFSRGGLTVSKRRHALSDESTRASILLGSWASIEGLIPKEKAITALQDKSKRSKSTENSTDVVDTGA